MSRVALIPSTGVSRDLNAEVLEFRRPSDVQRTSIGLRQTSVGRPSSQTSDRRPYGRPTDLRRTSVRPSVAWTSNGSAEPGGFQFKSRDNPLMEA